MAITAFNTVNDLASSTLLNSITNTQTSLTANTSEGTKFGTASFIITIGQPGADGLYSGDVEKVLVGARSSDAFTSLTRSYGGTTAPVAGWAAGTPFRINWCEDYYNALVTAINALETQIWSTTTPALWASVTSLTLGGTAATTITIGHASGTTTLNLKGVTVAITGAATVTGDLTFTAGTLTTSAASALVTMGSSDFKIYNANATPAAANLKFLGKNASAAVVTYASIFCSPLTTTAGAEYGALSFALVVNGSQTYNQLILSSTGLTVALDLAVNGGDLTSTQTTFNLLNATVTTLNIGAAATTLQMGAATGTCTIANATTSVKNLEALTGSIVAGIDGSVRGFINLWDGGGGNTPSYILLHSANGTAHYIFVEQDGTLKQHTSAPTADGDGNVVGAQT